MSATRARFERSSFVQPAMAMSSAMSCTLKLIGSAPVNIVNRRLCRVYWLCQQQNTTTGHTVNACALRFRRRAKTARFSQGVGQVPTRCSRCARVDPERCCQVRGTEETHGSVEGSTLETGGWENEESRATFTEIARRALWIDLRASSGRLREIQIWGRPCQRQDYNRRRASCTWAHWRQRQCHSLGQES